VVDGQGLPLTQALSGANLHDSQMALPLLDSISPVKAGRGRPRCRPHKLHGDKAYDYRFIRRGLRRRHIRPRIARRGIDSSQRLGRHRWKVERTGAWLHGMRRLAVRYERRADIHYALLQLGCCAVLFLALTRWF
jgi:hypothetical protein